MFHVMIALWRPRSTERWLRFCSCFFFFSFSAFDTTTVVSFFPFFGVLLVVELGPSFFFRIFWLSGALGGMGVGASGRLNANNNIMLRDKKMLYF